MKSPFKALYEEAGLDKTISRSLTFILMANLFGTLGGNICGSGTTAMVGLATSMNATDFEFGVIAAIVQIAAFLQIPFSLLVNRTQKRKRYILTFGLGARTLWLLFGLVPFIVPDFGRLRIWTVILLLGLVSSGNAMVNVCWFPWLSDLCPPRIQSRWLSIREVIINISNVLFGIFAAYLLDTLPPESKYVIIFLLGGVLCVLDAVQFFFVKEVYNAPSKKLKIRQVLKDAWQNKSFMQFTLLWTAWCFATNFSSVYCTPYSMNEMGLTNMQITIFGTVTACVMTALLVPRWGRAIFRFGGKNVMTVALFGNAINCIFYLLAKPGSIWPTFLFNFVGAFFWSGSNLAANAMQLSTTPDDSRPAYIAIFACVTCVVGTAFGSVVGGWMLDWWNAAGWFTGSFDRYKVLFTIGTALRYLVFFLFVPKLVNDSKFNWHDLLRDAMKFPTRR